MKTSLNTRRGLDRAKGFTLVEVLLALSITAVMAGMATYLLVETGRSTYVASEKMSVNRDIRQVMNSIVENGREADKLYLFDTYEALVYTPIDGEYGHHRLSEKQSGDFILLVYEGSVASSSLGYPIEKIIGIYRDPTVPAGNEAPVKMFTVDSVATADAFKDPEELIPDISNIPNHETILDLSEDSSAGGLFFSYKENSSFIFNAKIVHGGSSRKVTNTYNLTIRARGGYN